MVMAVNTVVVMEGVEMVGVVMVAEVTEAAR